MKSSLKEKRKKKNKYHIQTLTYRDFVLILMKVVFFFPEIDESG